MDTRVIVLCFSAFSLGFLPALNGIQISSNNNDQNDLVAPLYSVPFQVLLNFTISDSSVPVPYRICGGSLISSNYVLTSGSCCYKASRVEITLGANNISETEPSQLKLTSNNFTIHDAFKPNEGKPLPENNIALILLPNSVPTNDYIKMVKLAQEDVNYTEETARVCGWGKSDYFSDQYSSVLLYTEDQVISNDECRDDFTDLTENEVCLGGSSEATLCTGDFGSPLVLNNTQIGIASVGSMLCMQDYPTVYTRVSKFLCWIQQNTGLSFDCHANSTTASTTAGTSTSNVVPSQTKTESTTVGTSGATSSHANSTIVSTTVRTSTNIDTKTESTTVGSATSNRVPETTIHASFAPIVYKRNFYVPLVVIFVAFLVMTVWFWCMPKNVGCIKLNFVEEEKYTVSFA